METIAVLSSGDLGYKILKKIVTKYDVKFILTDKRSSDIIALANEHGIPCYAGNPRKGRGHEAIKQIQVDVVASINYLFLVEEDIINHPKKLIFNIHGSLLPKYRGRTPHVWAIINGEEKAGITAHEVNSGCDTGRIIHQIEVPIETEDTGADMLLKYEELYFPLVEKVMTEVTSNTISFKEQDHKVATYYGKRIPTDGLIDWNLSSEGIRNWVRAQANPYPGAFTFYLGQKITIDKVSKVKFMSKNNHQNGEIVQIEPTIIVKTHDGYLKLDTIREEKITFKEGNIFNDENR